MITFGTPKHHWNYFLAIEKDLENLSRYIEFSDANLGTYSNVKHQRNNHFHEANLKNCAQVRCCVKNQIYSALIFNKIY